MFCTKIMWVPPIPMLSTYIPNKLFRAFVKYNIRVSLLHVAFVDQIKNVQIMSWMQ